MKGANGWGKLFYFIGTVMGSGFVFLLAYASTSNGGCFEGCSGHENSEIVESFWRLFISVLFYFRCL